MSMSRIEISRQHDLPPEARTEALDDLTRYLQDFGARVNQSGDTLTFTGKGFEGSVCVRPGLVRGQIKLGLLARPFRHQLESEINRHLDARLGVQ